MKVMQPIRDLGDPVADLVGPMPYVQMQSLLDALWPKGTQAYMKAGYFRELDDHAIETMARFHQNATSPSSEIHIQHFGGAIARVAEDESAYGERQAPFVLNTIAVQPRAGRVRDPRRLGAAVLRRDRALADRRRLHQLPLGGGRGAGARPPTGRRSSPACGRSRTATTRPTCST